MELSVTKLLIILVIVIALFGGSKLTQMMNDMGKSIRSFKEGMKDEKKPETPRQISDINKDGNV